MYIQLYNVYTDKGEMKGERDVLHKNFKKANRRDLQQRKKGEHSVNRQADCIYV